MNTKEKKNAEPTSIMEAIETLSSIADMEIDRDVGIAREHRIFVQGRPVNYHTVHWLQQQDAGATMDVVKETFKVVLNYLKKFYQTEYAYVSDPKKIEGIKTIMLLIGEAAKKLDRYTSLFKHQHLRSVTESKEYKQLQEFYFTKVSKQTDEGNLGKWLLNLTQRSPSPTKSTLKLQGKKANLTKHLFVDLESVKKDTEYELFFIRKEDGSRFFSPRLIRNIKLVCDFGTYFDNQDGEDPLKNVRLWEDMCIQTSAKNLIRSLGNTVDRFYQEAAPFKDRELVKCLKKVLMALFLSASNQHLYDKNPVKSCKEYFHDFQCYFRTALHSREYHKLLAYPPRHNSKIAHCLLDTMHALSMGIFEFMQGYQEFAPVLNELLLAANEQAEHRKEPKKATCLWKLLSRDYTAMSKLIKRHPHGPIRKILTHLDSGFYHYYDPIAQGNLPNILYHIYFPEHKTTCIRLPSPTSQEFIHKGSVTHEFKSFLNACSTHSLIQRHLLFNLQDRTSWKEHMRCLALEELQDHHDFKNCLTVVTLPKDTDFYHQLSPYHQDNTIKLFIQHFKEHLTDANTGIWIPGSMRESIFPSFIDAVIDAVHRIFFSGKNMLLREHRLDFIEIVYLFLELKIIELVKPDSFSMTCKDSIDSGASAAAEMYAFLRLLQPDEITEADRNVLNTILYTPALLHRERIMLVERFNRFLNAVRVIEGVRDQLGNQNFAQIIHEAFGWLYRTQIFTAKLIPLR